ncbi:MAG: YheC/YheD family protein [Firmicutes bacterium]|nr:YheC/YheD family protein [Dethiobacter sp.]MBS3888522.1 YheC/YheD family protein [Bacillota bacterium]
MLVRVELAALLEDVGGSIMRMPWSLMRDLGVSESTLEVCLGQSMAQAQVERLSAEDDDRRVYLSKPLLMSLHLNECMRLGFWREQGSNRLRLGPVLGILVGLHSDKMLGLREKNIRDFARLARQRGALTYAFGASDIDWQRSCITGWVFNRHKLVRMECPLPDVVYDKVSSRRVENSGAVIEMKDRLREYPRLKYYNLAFFNKWDVHCLLAAHPLLSKFLPSTAELTPERLLEYLGRYRAVFVKPTEGSLGSGILRIGRVGTLYSYRFTRLNRPDLQGVCYSSDKVVRLIKKLMQQGQYVVQRGLRLARVNGGPFDCRVLLQKNLRNKWVVESIVARVAEPGNIISNMSDGAYLLHPRQALLLSFGPQGNSSMLIRTMRRIARATALAIEKGMGMEFAEMGVDLAFDTNGRLWILEANSRPGRQTNDLRERHVSSSVVRFVGYLCSRGRL